MHHAQARRDRVERRTEAHRRVAQPNLAFVRLLRGRKRMLISVDLAGAVLAHHGEDLAALDGEVDAVVGEQRRRSA